MRSAHQTSTSGLTATPAGKTIGFFNQNLVMQYGHDEAVTDGVNGAATTTLVTAGGNGS